MERFVIARTMRFVVAPQQYPMTSSCPARRCPNKPHTRMDEIPRPSEDVFPTGLVQSATHSLNRPAGNAAAYVTNKASCNYSCQSIDDSRVCVAKLRCVARVTLRQAR